MPRVLRLAVAAVLFTATLIFAAAADSSPVTARFSGAASQAKVSDEWAPYEHWITGDIFIEDGVLFFRTDKPVRGNPRRNVVLLGTTKDAVGLLPIYVSAAQDHKKFRLFGALLPCSNTFKSHPGPLPNVQFITWKLHLPNDPDVLPPGDRIIFKGRQATINGKNVILEDAGHHDIEAESQLVIHHANGQDSGDGASATP